MPRPQLDSVVYCVITLIHCLSFGSGRPYWHRLNVTTMEHNAVSVDDLIVIVGGRNGTYSLAPNIYFLNLTSNTTRSMTLGASFRRTSFAMGTTSSKTVHLRIFTSHFIS